MVFIPPFYLRTPLTTFGQLNIEDNAVGLVDDGTKLPQKLVLRTVRAEYTLLAETKPC
jgi:hypothetical protein